MSYDLDDDIFNEDEDVVEESPQQQDDVAPDGHLHTIDGTICPTCKLRHPNIASELDETAKEAFLTFLDRMPPQLVRDMLEEESRNKRKPQADMLNGFMRFTEKMDNTGTTFPVLRAIVDVIDEQTDGHLSKMWKVYDYERVLAVTHAMRRSTREAIQDAHEEKVEVSKGFKGLLDLIMDYIDERMEMLREEYFAACIAADYEPKPSIIEEGKYDYPEEQNSVIIELQKFLSITGVNS